MTAAVYHISFFQAIVIGLVQGLTELFPSGDLPQGDVAYGCSRPGSGPPGLVPFYVERGGDLAVGPASTTQLDDASDGFLFGLNRSGVALASLARGGVAERVVAHCLAATSGLRGAAVTQVLRDHLAVKLGKYLQDLSRAHHAHDEFSPARS
jgi:hypothetical protein